MRRIEFSEEASRYLLKCDKSLAKKLISKIELLNTFPIPLDVKKLKGFEKFSASVTDHTELFLKFTGTCFSLIR